MEQKLVGLTHAVCIDPNLLHPLVAPDHPTQTKPPHAHSNPPPYTNELPLFYITCHFCPLGLPQ